MFRIQKTYTDFNGNERKEDFYFHLTEAEVMKMQLGTTGGLAETIQRLIDLQDGPAILKIFEDLVLKSYGVKSPDGREFIKNQALRDSFMQTQAYSDIYVELATDADKAAKFINGILPANLAKQVADAQLPVS